MPCPTAVSSSNCDTKAFEETNLWSNCRIVTVLPANMCKDTKTCRFGKMGGGDRGDIMQAWKNISPSILWCHGSFSRALTILAARLFGFVGAY